MAPPMAAWAVVGSYVLMVLSNYLSMKKFFGGKDNKQISDEHPTYVSPDGKTFAIWGMIYLMETVTVVAQAIPSTRTEELMGRRCSVTGLDVRERMVFAFLANAVWLPFFTTERFWGALIIMVIYLGFLLGVYKDLNVSNTTGVTERICFTAGIALNASWIVVALMVNTFLCLGLVGWQDQYGVAGSVPAAMVVVALVAILGMERALQQCDLAWSFVAAWALLGIYRMQSVPDRVRFPISALSSTLSSYAFWCSMAVWATMATGAGLAVYFRFIRK